jgi:hypothetical protein
VEVKHPEQHAQPAELDEDILALAELGDARLPQREGLFLFVVVRPNAERPIWRPAGLARETWIHVTPTFYDLPAGRLVCCLPAGVIEPSGWRNGATAFDEGRAALGPGSCQAC